eukprot:scaffold1277_cov253-Pinguiococcus_pyrenoidosus.AAC.31
MVLATGQVSDRPHTRFMGKMTCNSRYRRDLKLPNCFLAHAVYKLLVDSLLVDSLLVDSLLAGSLLVGSLLVGSLLVGSLLVGSLLVGSLLVGSLLVGSLHARRLAVRHFDEVNNDAQPLLSVAAPICGVKTTLRLDKWHRDPRSAIRDPRSAGRRRF